MYKEWISRQTHGIVKNDSYEAEPLEVKLRKATEEKKPIEAVAPMIYTEKSKGVIPEYDRQIRNRTGGHGEAQQREIRRGSKNGGNCGRSRPRKTKRPRSRRSKPQRGPLLTEQSYNRTRDELLIGRVKIRPF